MVLFCFVFSRCSIPLWRSHSTSTSGVGGRKVRWLLNYLRILEVSFVFFFIVTNNRAESVGNVDTSAVYWLCERQVMGPDSRVNALCRDVIGAHAPITSRTTPTERSVVCRLDRLIDWGYLLQIVLGPLQTAIAVRRHNNYYIIKLYFFFFNNNSEQQCVYRVHHQYIKKKKKKRKNVIVGNYRIPFF